MADLRRLLGEELRVEVVDGRVITGLFHCVDQERNLILRDSIQEQIIAIPNLPGSFGERSGRVIMRRLISFFRS